MNLQSKFGYFDFEYCNLFVSGTELRTNKRTDRQTDRRTIRLLEAPGGPFRPEHKNRSHDLFMTGHCIAEISLNVA